MAEFNELTQKVTEEYDASQIQVLEGLEAVRKRPGMYIGSTSSSGLHHLVYEIVDNSIDEALAGYCTHIEVSIESGDIIRVSDNGRGIPVDIQEQTGKSALEVVFTVLHAGGKFGGGGYKVSGGLHGVGASVVNALSEWLTVQVHKDGNIYEMSFSRGDIVESIHIVGKTDHTGTTVRFKPDPEMFDDTVYDYEKISAKAGNRARACAMKAVSGNSLHGSTNIKPRYMRTSFIFPEAKAMPLRKSPCSIMTDSMKT